jgi:hypothetical protein
MHGRKNIKKISRKLSPKVYIHPAVSKTFQSEVITNIAKVITNIAKDSSCFQQYPALYRQPPCNKHSGNELQNMFSFSVES